MEGMPKQRVNRGHSPVVLGLRKALKNGPKVHCVGHDGSSKLHKVPFVLGDHQLLAHGDGHLCIPIMGSHRIKPFGSNRFDFFFLSGAAMTCHVKAFY